MEWPRPHPVTLQYLLGFGYQKRAVNTSASSWYIKDVDKGPSYIKTDRLAKIGKNTPCGRLLHISSTCMIYKLLNYQSGSYLTCSRAQTDLFLCGCLNHLTFDLNEYWKLKTETSLAPDVLGRQLSLGMDLCKCWNMLVHITYWITGSITCWSIIIYSRYIYEKHVLPIPRVYIGSWIAHREHTVHTVHYIP